MIRAGRQHLVRTKDMLAQDMGMAAGTFSNKKPYAAKGFPQPISSQRARLLLWDSEQTAAFLAGDPVPDLPPAGSDEDLLDRYEAADVLGVEVKTWDKYKTDPQIAQHLVVVHGVEHCPRGIVRAFKDSRPGRQAATGRPKGSRNIPRDQLHDRIAALLDAAPAITINEVCDVLGVAYSTAQRALATARGDRIAALMTNAPGLSFEQAADQLGYPPVTHRAAREAAARTQRGDDHG
ncbi:helix-turn-helix domain-containing protein [Streptomyces sp. NPDC044780]|uniref:helix-turn-helix domain-containing protein n=1 Tax=unclassified Streptomyces TaxID=2593676 RepID=UPI0033E86E2F